MEKGQIVTFKYRKQGEGQWLDYKGRFEEDKGDRICVAITESDTKTHEKATGTYEQDRTAAGKFKARFRDFRKEWMKDLK